MPNKETEIIFRPIEGIWQDVTGDSGTLADTLKRFNIIIDDTCEYARFRINQNTTIYYRAYYGSKITITIVKF